MAQEVKFEAWMTQAFDLYKRNLAVLAVAGLIAGVLSSITFFILAGPMLAGMILIALRLRRGTEPKPEVGALFDGFKHFAQTFIFLIVWAILYIVGSAILGSLPLVGQAASVFGGIMLGALLMFAPFLIVDRGMAFWPASMASINAVKTTFWPLLAYCVVSQILSQIGIFACFIGIFVTMPFGICALTVAYDEYFRDAPATPPPAQPSQPAQPAQPSP